MLVRRRLTKVGKKIAAWMLVIALSMGSTDVSVLAGEVAGSDLGGGSYGTQAENGETESAGEEESGAESNTSGESGESGAAQESGESNASGESSTAQESEESGAAQATGEADTTEATEATDATETLAESETAETEETEETEESTMALLLGNAQQAATITYEANGGSGEMDVTSGTVGEDVTISACSFTYTDHIFSCWNTAADGSGTSYSAGASLEMPQGGLTLYARWEDTEESSDYRLLVNGVSLPVGTSDGWYRLSYDADATFSVTVGSESYTSGINVYYASSMDALSSSTTKWTSTPAVGEYYLAFNIPLEAIVPDPSTYNYKIAVVDTVAPTVESFTVSGDHLLVEAYDEGAGLVSYAISTATSKEAVAESDWVSVGNAPVTGTDGISLEEDYSDLAAGTYYLYVQDASGNIARSGAVVYISALSIEEYYQDNVLTTYRESFATVASDPAASLPETSRTKFTFDGYYDNASYNGDVLSGSIVIAKGTEQTVYAKWSLQGVSFTTDLDASYTRTYDGEDLTLSVALSDTYNELSFSWEYSETEDGEFTTLSGGENGSYALRSVSESGYYRAVAQITEDGVSAQARSSTTHVTINKRPLSLSIDDQTISYRSEAPVYTVSAAAADATSGLVGEDTLSTALGEHYAANLVCDYRNDGSANSAAGTYEITAGEGFASTDYELTVTSGTLTVTPIELSDASDVTVTLEADSFTYTGSAIEPAVTAVSVTCQEETVTLSEEDYTVSYASNAAVTDAAQVILTFRGNYTGSYSGKTFAITKATYTVQTSMSLSTWKYGDTSVSATPSVDDYRGGTITYHYLEKGDEESFEAADTSGALTTMPTDAGTYYVWATIGETANYNAITALPAEFTIAQREITLTSASQTWTYDGNAHTAGTYVQSGDGFAEGEGFLSVTVSGSVKNVAEPVTNAITYTLSSATNAENYAITLAEGTLRVTQAPLPQITSLAWGSSAGTLTWVAITRDGLNINYEIQLYKDGEMLGEPLTTSATSLSVKEIIRADSIANGVGGYSATITAKIAEDDAGMYLNYTEGTASALLAEKYTARVALSQNGGDEGIASYAFTGASHREDEDDTVTYLLQGESAVATVTYADGYEADTELPAIQYTAGSTGLSSDAFVVADEESGAGYYRIRFASGTLSAAVQSTVVVKSLDSAPVCELFTGTQAEDYSYVRARFIITDELGLYGYQIVPSVDEITDDGWTEITPLNEVKEFQTSVDLTAAGDYYLVYKDNGGNIRYCETPVTVYAVSFDKNADDAQGEMETIYKLKGATVVLPANTFTYAGYVFTNWTGNGAILPDEASYVKDANVTLYAGWTNKRYSYSVHYYYQTFSLNEDGTVVTDEDGNVVLSYSDTPDSTETYSCAYNYELSYDNEAIRKDREGYTLTGTPEISGTYVSQITVTQDEMSLNIYYQLNRYRMSYTYTDYDGSSASITKYFYYGEPFVEVAKPSHVGYSFIGWNYGDGGVAPTTMPAGNVSATGSFKANTASYIIRYYFQNLDANNADGNYLAYSFALDSSLQAEEVISADYGTAIHAYVSSTDAATDESTSAKIVTAREITGFTPAAVVVSYESSDAMTGISDATAFETFVNDTSADADTTHAVYSAITGDIPDGVQNGPTYVSFYYTRNTYTLSMDVYQGNRDLGIHLFGSYYDGTDGKEDDQAIWTFPYGYIFPEEGNDLSAAYFETYGYLSEGTQTYDNGKVHSVAWTARWQGEVTADKYYLADFVDWSTGTRPVTMPAGNVKVVREYASREQSKYRIEVYLETVKETDHGTYKSDDAGYYELETTVERYIEPGKTVTIADSGEASDTTILVSKLMESIECKEYYQHDGVAEYEVLSGVILENQYDEDNNLKEKTMTVLKLYMSRKSYPVTVNYYRRDYDESDGSYTQTKLTGYTLSQKWGTSYFIDSEYYYSGEVTSSVPTGSNTDDPNAHTYLGNVQSADAVENLADFDTLGYGIANYWYYYSPTATTALNMGGYVGGHGDYTQYDADYTVDNDRYKKIKVGTGAESSSTQTHADIYYLQPVDTRHYFLKLTYRKYDSETGLLIGDTLMTYDDNGTTYQVCVANRSDIFETTDGVESLRSEFEAVPVTYSGVDLDGASVEGTFYRIKNDTRTTPLLFAAIDSNPFYIGNLASFNYNRDVTAHIGRELFDAEDNTPAASYGTATKVAHGVERISTEGCEYPIAGVGEGTEDLFETQLCYYFDFVKDFAITYSYDGKTNRIDYGQIVTVDAEDIGYDKDGKAGGIAVFDPGEGYEIVWYKDALHTEVADDDIELTGPVTLYGVRFNKPIENLDVAYYQLPNSTSYYTGSLDDLYAVEEPITISYAYNSATVVEKSGTYTKYYKSQSEPILYASTRSHYVTAYNEFSLPYTDYVLSGYAYDEKNTNNVLSGFCGSSAIKLRAYYERTSATLTVRKNDSANANDEVTTQVNGSAIQVTNPQKQGYTLTGWKLYDNTDTENPTELSTDDYDLTFVAPTESSVGSVTFSMPICPTLLIAQWSPAEIDFEIVHLYQDNSMTYQQDLLDAVRAGEETGESVVTQTNGSVTYYYIDTADANHLFAAVETLSGVKSEDVITVNDHNLAAAIGDMFTFSTGTYQHDADDSKALSLTAEGQSSFAAYVDAEVTYYYERENSIVIVTQAYCSDGAAETGLTLSGAGSYYYGQEVTLYATMQPTGYTFRGWYLVASADGLTAAQIQDLESLITAADAGESDVLTKVSDATQVSLDVTASGNYIAVTTASVALTPEIEIEISRDLETDPLYYNYASDTRNQFNATVNWGEGVDSGANNIKAYTWYYYDASDLTQAQFEALDIDAIDTSEMTEIANSNTNTFNLPTGYAAGYYVLRCVAQIERKDNGRTSLAEGSYRFAILPNEAYLETTALEDQSYTGSSYTYTENWIYTPQDYTIYYSESPFTVGEDVTDRLNLEDGNAQKAVLTKPEYRDVVVDDVHNPIAHTVYYYVESRDPNYASLTGSSSVEILPVTVTVTAKKAFTKIYDGRVEVQGKPDDTQAGSVTYKYSEADGTYSDYYRLQSGIEAEGETADPYYTINGILAVDSDKTMMLNFDAEFDYPHASGSGTQEGTLVTLTNLWVLSSDAESGLHEVYENWNYVFPSGQTLLLSGQIKPYPLEIKWVPTEADYQSEDVESATYAASQFYYTYTGSEQAPLIKIVGDTSRIPDSTDEFSVSVKNKQTNAGTYQAIPEVEAAENATYFPTDYTFTLENQTYKILPRSLRVSPADVTRTYNATAQTMLDTAGEFVFESRESESDSYSAYTLPGGEYYSATASAAYTDAGVYEGITTQTLSIYTLNNGVRNVITDNYVVEYGTGTLTIEPCPVQIDGITGVDKEYDGTVDAALDLSQARITLASDGTSSIYAGDALTLECVGTPGDFASASVGNDKTVTIYYVTDDQTTRGVALKAEGAYQNYKIDTERSQSTTTANILKNGKINIYLTSDDTEITYGETLPPSFFDYTFDELASGDSIDTDVIRADGYPKFRIMKQDESGAYVNAVAEDHSFSQSDDLSFIGTLDVGTYDIFFVEKTDEESTGHHFVEGFSSEKYNICWDYEHPVTITVNKRKIMVSGIDTAAEITREYNGEITVPDEAKALLVGEGGSHDYYAWSSVPNISASGVLVADADKLVISGIEAVYNSKDVATETDGVVSGATKISVSEAVLSGEAAGNYQLINSTFDVPAAITPKEVTVTVNNQTTTYGSAQAAYEFTLDGEIAADTETILAGFADAAQTTIDCDYSAVETPAEGKSHNAGYYAMNINAQTHYTNANYSFTFPTAQGNQGDSYGLLTVEKKTLHYTASDETISYGVENPPTIYDGAFTEADFAYGESIATQKNAGEQAKILGQGVDGSVPVYTDSALTSTATDYVVEFTCMDGDQAVSASSVAGDYAITPANVESLYTQNYTLVAVNGTLTITKFYLLVKGVEIAPKTYDGTKVVDPGQIGLDAVTVTYYDGAQKKENISYEDLPEEYQDSLAVSAQYLDKNVSESVDVDLSITIVEGSYLDERYQILTAENAQEAAQYDKDSIFTGQVTQTGTTGKITAKRLTLTPKDLTIAYATSVTDDMIAVTGVGFVTDESISDILDYALGYVFSPAYTAGSDVGTYKIDIRSTQPGSGVRGNYEIGFAYGTMTVTQAAFPAPTNLSWSGGVLSWDAVAKIGNVTVAGYELTLAKEGMQEPITTIACHDGTRYDFTSLIRESGEGTYTVSIRTVADTKNNTDYQNVAQYSDSTASAAKKAVKVTPKFATDAVTQQAINVTGNANLYLMEETLPESYVMIAGESAQLHALFTWSTQGTDGGTYVTGYEVKSFAASVSSGAETATASNEAANAGTFDGKVTITDEITETAIDLVLTLQKKAAQGSETITADADSAPYGALEHPAYTANVTHNESVGYTYSYNWYYVLNGVTFDSTMEGIVDVVKTIDEEGNITTTNNPVTWDAQSFTFPRGKRAQAYQVYCEVTATRKDNGESVVLSANKTFTITKPTAGDASYLVLTVHDWTYGESRQPASAVALFGSDMGTISYEYRMQGQGEDSFSSSVPTAAGTYEVRAKTSGTDDYPAVTSVTKTFTIAKGTLQTPANFTMNPDGDGNPYGLLTWDAVSGLSENAGTDPASDVTVSYEVKILLQARNADGSYDAEETVKTVVVTETELNVLSDITSDGKYRYEIRALANPRTASIDNNNCNNSASASIDTLIIGAKITSDVEGNTKEYDAEPITLTAGYSDNSASYEYTWYKDGSAIAGASGKTLEVTNVSQSGLYSVSVVSTNGGETPIASKSVQVTITKRPVEITAASDTKTYDGSALTHAGTFGTARDAAAQLTQEMYEIAYKGSVSANAPALVGGAQVSSLTFTGAQTDAGESASTPSGVQITNADGLQNANYEITYQVGTLTVTKKAVTMTAPSAQKTYDGTALTAPGIGDAVPEAKQVSVQGLLDTHILSEVSMSETSTITDAGEQANHIVTSSVKFVDTADENRDVTGNYSITVVDGLLTVTKAPAEIEAPDLTVVYDGSAHEIAATMKGNAQTEVFRGATLKYALIGTDEDGNDVVGEEVSALHFVHAGTYRIRISLPESENHLAATSIERVLTITKRPLILLADSNSKTYDGAPHTPEDSAYTITEETSLASTDTIASIDVYCDGSAVYAGESESAYVKDAVIQNASGEVVNSDYEITYREGVLAIVKRALVITAKDHEKSYDGEVLTAGIPADLTEVSDPSNDWYTIGGAGLVNGDTLTGLTISGSILTAGSSDAIPADAVIRHGESDVTASYEITYVKGELKISQRPITISAQNQSKAYDGLALAYSGAQAPDENLYKITSGSLAEGDALTSLVLTGSQLGTGESVLSASDAVIVNGEEVRSDNYAITYVHAKLIVTGAALDITAGDLTKVYDGESLTLANAELGEKLAAVTIRGLAEGDTVSAVQLAGSITNVGSIALVPSGIQITRAGVDVTDRYSISYHNGSLSITKRPITVEAQDARGVYGTAPDQAGFTYRVISGSEVTAGEAQITYQCSATAASDIGTYAITPVGGNRNYDVTAIDGSYTVSKRPITITAGSATAAYEPGISLMKNSYTLTSGSLAAGDRISEIRVSGAQETVGSSANVASDAQIQKGSKDVTGNYEIRYADGTLTVEKGIQQIIASDLTIEYDGRAHRIDEIERYLKYSDETTITVNAAISEITEPGEIEATFTVPESALYLAAEKTVMLRVTKRAITISADSASKVYDGEELSMETWSITRGSLLEGDEIVEDSLSVRAENESGTIVQIGTVANIISGDAVIMRGLTEMTQYYDITYQNGSLSIRSRETQSSGNGGRDGGESGGAAAPDPAEDLQETVQEQETEPREEKEQSEPDGQQAEAESGAQSVIAVWPKITIDLTNEKNEDAQSGGEPVTIDYSKAIVGTVTGGNLSENIAHQRVTITDSEDSNKIIDCDVVSADIERMIEELLSSDEKEVLAEGSNLRFRVEVTRDDENLSEEIRESVTQAMEEKMTIVGMFDASFFVKIGNGDETRINDPYSSVRVSFTIPDELWDASMVGNAQILRTYRNADGVLVTEVAVAEITDQTVVMDADNYSAYTLVNGVVTATIHGELEDDCYIHWLILCLLIIALYSVAHFYRKKRREVREEKASGEEITPDRGQRRHRLWLLVVNAAGLILFFYGSCHWDLIALIALILGSGGAEVIASHRYNNFLEQQDL